MASPLKTLENKNGFARKSVGAMFPVTIETLGLEGPPCFSPDGCVPRNRRGKPCVKSRLKNWVLKPQDPLGNFSKEGTLSSRCSKNSRAIRTFLKDLREGNPFKRVVSLVKSRNIGKPLSGEAPNFCGPITSFLWRSSCRMKTPLFKEFKPWNRGSWVKKSKVPV